jgi:hypothetical protein
VFLGFKLNIPCKRRRKVSFFKDKAEKQIVLIASLEILMTTNEIPN